MRVGQNLSQSAAIGPTAAIADSFPRHTPATNLGTGSVLTSGTMKMVGFYLPGGMTITNINVLSGTTQAAGTPTNSWAGIYSSALAKIQMSGDGSTTAWATNTVRTFALASTYTTTAEGFYYVAFMQAASTTPTLYTTTPVSVGTTLLALAPALCGNSSTGLTTVSTAPATAAAITLDTAIPYVYLS